MLLDALLATLRDVGIAVVVGMVAASLLFVVLGLCRAWMRKRRVNELRRVRTPRVAPCDFAGEIHAYRVSRDRELAGERRAAR